MYHEETKTPSPPSSHVQALSWAGNKLLEATNGNPEQVVSSEINPPEDFYNYCFKLQVEIENEGGMDYNTYADRMWRKFSPNQTGAKEGFERFRQGLIAGMHGIDMSKSLVPDLQATIPKLLGQYGEEVVNVSMWSKGDVEATGYQTAKINSSGVVSDFKAGLRASGFKGKASKYMAEKTRYMVADDKFAALKDYVGQRLKDKNEPVKLVIIEDSTGNFAVAEKLFAKEIESGQVSVVPIWFTGTRSGITAQAKVDTLQAAGDPSYETEKAKLEAKRNSLNAVDSFAELLDESRFGEIFRDAHVMVDFDGVIGDNVVMREHQAAVTYGALMAGLETATGLTQAELEPNILESLKPKATA